MSDKANHFGTRAVSAGGVHMSECIRSGGLQPLRPWKFAAALLVATLPAAVPVAAQWVHYPTPGLPRAADGGPNLRAPTPKTPDGKPDLSGIWHSTDRRYLFDLATDVGEAPFQPWAAALYKERQTSMAKDRPSGHCLPHTL